MSRHPFPDPFPEYYLLQLLDSWEGTTTFSKLFNWLTTTFDIPQHLQDHVQRTEVSNDGTRNVSYLPGWQLQVINVAKDLHLQQKLLWRSIPGNGDATLSLLGGNAQPQAQQQQQPQQQPLQNQQQQFPQQYQQAQQQQQIQRQQYQQPAPQQYTQPPQQLQLQQQQYVAQAAQARPTYSPPVQVQQPSPAPIQQQYVQQQHRVQPVQQQQQQQQRQYAAPPQQPAYAQQQQQAYVPPQQPQSYQPPQVAQQQYSRPAQTPQQPAYAQPQHVAQQVQRQQPQQYTSPSQQFHQQQHAVAVPMQQLQQQRPTSAQGHSLPAQYAMPAQPQQQQRVASASYASPHHNAAQPQHQHLQQHARQPSAVTQSPDPSYAVSAPYQRPQHAQPPQYANHVAQVNAPMQAIQAAPRQRQPTPSIPPPQPPPQSSPPAARPPSDTPQQQLQQMAYTHQQQVMLQKQQQALALKHQQHQQQQAMQSAGLSQQIGQKRPPSSSPSNTVPQAEQQPRQMQQPAQTKQRTSQNAYIDLTAAPPAAPVQSAPPAASAPAAGAGAAANISTSHAKYEQLQHTVATFFRQHANKLIPFSALQRHLALQYKLPMPIPRRFLEVLSVTIRNMATNGSITAQKTPDGKDHLLLYNPSAQQADKHSDRPRSADIAQLVRHIDKILKVLTEVGKVFSKTVNDNIEPKAVEEIQTKRAAQVVQLLSNFQSLTDQLIIYLQEYDLTITTYMQQMLVPKGDNRRTISEADFKAALASADPSKLILTQYNRVQDVRKQFAEVQQRMAAAARQAATLKAKETATPQDSKSSSLQVPQSTHNNTAVSPIPSHRSVDSNATTLLQEQPLKISPALEPELKASPPSVTPFDAQHTPAQSPANVRHQSGQSPFVEGPTSSSAEPSPNIFSSSQPNGNTFTPERYDPDTAPATRNTTPTMSTSKSHGVDIDMLMMTESENRSGGDGGSDKTRNNIGDQPSAASHSLVELTSSFDPLIESSPPTDGSARPGSSVRSQTPGSELIIKDVEAALAENMASNSKQSGTATDDGKATPAPSAPAFDVSSFFDHMTAEAAQLQPPHQQ